MVFLWRQKVLARLCTAAEETGAAAGDGSKQLVELSQRLLRLSDNKRSDSIIIIIMQFRSKVAFDIRFRLTARTVASLVLWRLRRNRQLLSRDAGSEALFNLAELWKTNKSFTPYREFVDKSINIIKDEQQYTLAAALLALFYLASSELYVEDPWMLNAVAFASAIDIAPHPHVK